MARLASEDRRGLWKLRMVATIAPWLGVLLTCLQWPTAFGGFGADELTIMSVILGRLGNVCVFIPIGLGAGLLAAGVEAGLRGIAASLDLSAKKGWAELRLLTR